MNGIQSRKAQSIEDAFPRCLGRMVNLFYLSNGMAQNRLLMGKPVHDGSSISRSQSDGTWMLSSSFEDRIEDKMIVSETRSLSCTKASGTPMKTLIAREMSKEVVSKHNPPNLVAKLMGLETLPYEQPNPASNSSHSRDYSKRSLSNPGCLMERWDPENGLLNKQMPCESRYHQEHNKCKDVHEVWQQTQKTAVRDGSPQKGSYNQNTDDKKMALVRQKFMEAKRLSTDEKGRQSKEFEDALEVLTSNKDLFLKFLQEPSSVFSQRLYDIQSITQCAETKRITVLKPSKVVDSENFGGSGKNSDRKTKKPANMGQVTGWDKHNSGHSPVFSNRIVDNYTAQPTRIVVLRPSPGKIHDIRDVVSPPSSSPRMIHGEEYFGEHEDDEAQESRELAKEITRKMRENLMGHRRDETLLSSVYSNGYIGDDSSFNITENNYAAGHASDSEIMSPTSKHSWDYINRFGSPYSSSSFSRASCSPESSVSREAKKRLSERWAMMSSNGRSQEQKAARRSSSTLGEMLALSDTKKSTRSEEEVLSKEQEFASCLTRDLHPEEESKAGSPRSLLRSKSVPASSLGFSTRVNCETTDTEAGMMDVPSDLMKTKSMKSSLKEKVSSLFFSKSKKSNRENYHACQSKDDCKSTPPEVPVLPSPLHKKINGDSYVCPANSFEDCLSPDLRGSSSNTCPDVTGATKLGTVSLEEGLSGANCMMSQNMNENQDQPSPISVLEPPFEEDDNAIRDPAGGIKPVRGGIDVPRKSNLIDKSPPIESIARTLLWDESCTVTATPYPLKSSSISSGAEEEEKDWFFLVKMLLSLAGLDGEVQSNAFFAKWHSPESPLLPSLRDKYANLNDKELLHEAKQRQRISNWKLLFDCVNAVLVETTSHGSEWSACSGAHTVLTEGAQTMLVDHVWAKMKEWFCTYVSCLAEDGGDSNSLLVEMVIRKEVVGKGWVDNMRAELHNLGNEIEDKVLEELVEEAVIEMTGRV